MTVQTDILEPAVYLTRQRMLDTGRYTLTSCVVAVTLTQRVLGAFGIDAKPMTVAAYASNAGWRALYDGKRSAAEIVKIDPHAYAIAIGDRTGATGLVDRTAGVDQTVGHVILYGPDWIADPSLDQAARGDDLPVGPLVGRIAPEAIADFREGKPVGFASALTGVEVNYVPYPTDRGYTRSPNWGRRDRSEFDRLAGSVIRELRETR